jgi:16S rRNA (uracil1498-N3)-methyltransferase
VLSGAKPNKFALLIGPEGGFTEPERKLIASMTQSVAVGLGSRIMKADTAAVAALACVQSVWGDWNE